MKFGDAASKLCTVACQMLGWLPDEFWDTTPTELALALRAPGEQSDAPDAATIEELRRRFPDQGLRNP
jgi:uncharacterized phage protein (TIGR02216 family)